MLPWTNARPIKLKKVKRIRMAPLDSCQVNKVEKDKEKMNGPPGQLLGQ